MSSWVEFVPSMLQASGTLKEGQDARLQAKMLKEHSRVAADQGARDEEAQRRSAMIAIDRQSAAVFETGGNTSTGSDARLLEQSAAFAELDALNIRYGSDLRSKGLLAESYSMKNRAKGAGLLAGAQLVQGYSRATSANRIAGA